MNIPKAKNRYLHDTHKPLMDAKDEARLITQYQEDGDEMAGEQVLLAHSPMIINTAKQLSGYGVEAEELVSEGFEAMSRALRKFEVNDDNRFTAFAYSYARFSMLTFITRNRFPVKLGSTSSIRHLFFSINKKTNNILEKAHKVTVGSTVIQELADECGVDVETVSTMVTMLGNNDINLDDPQLEFTTEINQVKHTESTSQSYENNQTTKIRSALLETAMDRGLSDRERTIFKGRELEDDTKTLNTLSTELGISRERVRQIHTIAMDKMNKEIGRVLRSNHMTSNELFD